MIEKAGRMPGFLFSVGKILKPASAKLCRLSDAGRSPAMVNVVIPFVMFMQHCSVKHSATTGRAQFA
jgi:hypothetical protein